MINELTRRLPTGDPVDWSQELNQITSDHVNLGKRGERLGEEVRKVMDRLKTFEAREKDSHYTDQRPPAEPVDPVIAQARLVETVKNMISLQLPDKKAEHHGYYPRTNGS